MRRKFLSLITVSALAVPGVLLAPPAAAASSTEAEMLAKLNSATAEVSGILQSSSGTFHYTECKACPTPGLPDIASISTTKVSVNLKNQEYLFLDKVSGGHVPLNYVDNISEKNLPRVLSTAKAPADTRAVSFSWSDPALKFVSVDYGTTKQPLSFDLIRGNWIYMASEWPKAIVQGYFDYQGLTWDVANTTGDGGVEQWTATTTAPDGSLRGEITMSVSAAGALLSLDAGVYNGYTGEGLQGYTLEYFDLGTATPTDPAPADYVVAPLSQVAPAAWKVTASDSMKSVLNKIAKTARKAKTPKGAIAAARKSMSSNKTAKANGWAYASTNTGGKYIVVDSVAGQVSFGIVVTKKGKKPVVSVRAG